MKKLFLIPALYILVSVEALADAEYCISRGNTSIQIANKIDEKCEVGDLLWVENLDRGSVAMLYTISAKYCNFRYTINIGEYSGNNVALQCVMQEPRNRKPNPKK